MAYTHSKYEVDMTPFIPATGAGPTANALGVNISVTGPNAEWAPGIVPHLIRGMTVMPLTGPVRSDPVHAKFRKAEVAGSAQATDWTNIGQVVLSTTVTTLGGGFYFIPTAHIEIKPGQSVQLHVTAAATAGAYAKAVLYVEPRWEEPGNITGLNLTTGSVTL